MSGLSKLTRGSYRWLAGVLVLLAAGVGVIAADARSDNGPPVLTVQDTAVGRAVPNGFVGLSMEYRGLEAYAGQDPAAISPPFVQLMRDLAPGQRPVLRIGGDGTDWTWYPVAGVSRPGGVKYSLNQTFLKVTRALAQALDARLVLGINFEADSRKVAGGEARALLGGIGRRYVEALELGNEPELYSAFNWYRNSRGVGVKGRPPGYNFAAYIRDFSSIAQSLPSFPLAGPSSGSPTYIAQLAPYLDSEPRVRLVTIHAYPLKHCSASASVTVGDLLSNAASAGLANGLAPDVAIAHRRGLALRVDEINAVSCGGVRGVSDAFASALWVLNTLFELARTGVDGVNVHTVPNTINELIGSSQVDGHWQDKVHPEYYGMMMFAQAAPAGSRLLQVSGSVSPAVETWATRAPDGHIRVVLINRSTSSRTVTVRIPSVSGTATVERLEAPSAQATSGVTLGGQSFGPETTTGLLAGASQITSLSSKSGGYAVTLPGTSAAMLTL
jgi:hypothetical protein